MKDVPCRDKMNEANRATNTGAEFATAAMLALYRV